MEVDHYSSNEDTNSVDGEGVWTHAIELAFQEADKLYPPCGRRKHIIQGEGGGKMLGRNELIAKYIRDKTGKIRTRKQVSSHIQVLARRKAKVDASVSSNGTPSPPDSQLNCRSNSRADLGYSTPINTVQHHGQATGIHQTASALYRPLAPQQQFNYQNNNNNTTTTSNFFNSHESSNFNVQSQNYHQHQQHHMIGYMSADWFDCPIATHKVRLVEFSAFVELKHPYPTATRPLALPSDDPSGSALGHLTGYVGGADPFSPSAAQQAARPFQYPYPQSSATSLNEPHLDNTTSLKQQESPLIRHSYIKIDYQNKLPSVANRLEHIHYNEVKDKFADPGLHQCPADALFLVKFWADINEDLSLNDSNSDICFSNLFETCEPYKYLNCSTRACSYGNQVVEKVEKVFGSYNNLNGRYQYQIDKSPMCDFMKQCIRKLRQLSEVSHMNNVLENLTALQVIESDRSEMLLCLAYVFEIPENRDCRPQHHVYRLIRD